MFGIYIHSSLILLYSILYFQLRVQVSGKQSGQSALTGISESLYSACENQFHCFNVTFQVLLRLT